MFSFFPSYFKDFCIKAIIYNNVTQRRGSVVPHGIPIPEVSGSIPGADQPDYGYFGISHSHQGEWQIGILIPSSPKRSCTSSYVFVLSQEGGLYVQLIMDHGSPPIVIF